MVQGRQYYVQGRHPETTDGRVEWRGGQTGGCIQHRPQLKSVRRFMALAIPRGRTP